MGYSSSHTKIVSILPPLMSNRGTSVQYSEAEIPSYIILLPLSGGEGEGQIRLCSFCCFSNKNASWIQVFFSTWRKDMQFIHWFCLNFELWSLYPKVRKILKTWCNLMNFGSQDCHYNHAYKGIASFNWKPVSIRMRLITFLDCILTGIMVLWLFCFSFNTFSLLCFSHFELMWNEPGNQKRDHLKVAITRILVDLYLWLPASFTLQSILGISTTVAAHQWLLLKTLLNVKSGSALIVVLKTTNILY